VSKYFQVLKRLEGARDDGVARPAETVAPPPTPVGRLVKAPTAPVAPVPPAAPVLPAAPVAPASIEMPATPEPPRRLTPPSDPQGRLAVPARPVRGIDTLFHNIDAFIQSRRPAALVFAGASSTPSVDSVVSGLGEFVERKGETVLVVRLRESGGSATLSCMYPPDAGRTLAKSEVTLRLDLRAPAAREVVAQWREQVLPGAGLTFFLGPPLRDSLDSALLASLCDGLIMVAVNDETHRGALTAAAGRLRLVNAPTLGVVVNDGREANPAWLRRILGQ
jgi:hypothetical protein